MGLARIILTSGEPAGIGPDLCVLIAQRAWNCELVAVADRQLLEQRARLLGRTVRLLPHVPEAERRAAHPRYIAGSASTHLS